MSDNIYKDVFEEDVVLTDSVRTTILLKHPESADFIEQIDRVLAEPDEIRHSVRDQRCVLYYRFEADVLEGKWVVVVVKQIDRNFIATVYATDQIKSGEVLWKKNT